MHVLCLCMYVCTPTRAHTHTHTHTRTHTHTHTHTPISACLGPDLVCGNFAVEYGIRTMQSAARRCSNQGLYVGERSTFEVRGVGAPLQ